MNCGSAQHVLVLGQERGTHEWDHLGAQAHSHDPVGRPGTEASAQEDVGVDHNVLYVTHATEDITPAARPPLGSPGPCTAVTGSEGIDKIYLADILARVYKNEARNDVERWSAKEDQRGTV